MSDEEKVERLSYKINLDTAYRNYKLIFEELEVVYLVNTVGGNIPYNSDWEDTLIDSGTTAKEVLKRINDVIDKLTSYVVLAEAELVGIKDIELNFDNVELLIERDELKNTKASIAEIALPYLDIRKNVSRALKIDSNNCSVCLFGETCRDNPGTKIHCDIMDHSYDKGSQCRHYQLGAPDTGSNY